MQLLKYTAWLCSVLSLYSCDRLFTEVPASGPEATFEYAWRMFDEEYAPFTERGVDWDSVYTANRPLLDATSTEEELFTVLTAALSSLDDGHVSLTAPGRPVFHANRIRREGIGNDRFRRPVIKQYLDADFREASDTSFLYGGLRNTDLAYIHFDHVGENLYELPEFVKRYADAPGLIIDLRHNRGGDFTYFFSEMGPLVDAPRVIFRSRTKNGSGRDDFTGWTEWSVTPTTPHYGKPIAVLTDRYTISAGERAVMALRALPNVITVGDTTNGAHGTMIGRELPNGWFTSLTPQQVTLPGGESLEGRGLPPDHVVVNTPELLSAGHDSVLDAAIELLQ